MNYSSDVVQLWNHVASPKGQRPSRWLEGRSCWPLASLLLSTQILSWTRISVCFLEWNTQHVLTNETATAATEPAVNWQTYFWELSYFPHFRWTWSRWNPDRWCSWRWMRWIRWKAPRMTSRPDVTQIQTYLHLNVYVCRRLVEVNLGKPPSPPSIHPKTSEMLIVTLHQCWYSGQFGVEF